MGTQLRDRWRDYSLRSKPCGNGHWRRLRVARAGERHNRRSRRKGSRDQWQPDGPCLLHHSTHGSRDHSAQPADPGRQHRGIGQSRGRHLCLWRAAPREHPHQGVPPALQHPAARRQVVSVHQGECRRTIPARHRDAPVRERRGALLRPVHRRGSDAAVAERRQAAVHRSLLPL